MMLNMSSIKGYTITATDGAIGKVVDMLFDDVNWQVRWLVVQTGGWFSNRKVLLPSSTLGHADAFTNEFSVKLNIHQVKHSPDIDTHLPVSRQMEADIYDHYGWAPYWGSGPFLGLYGYAGGLGRNSLRVEDPEVVFENELLDARRDSYDLHLRSIADTTGYHIHATDGSIGHIEDMLVEEADWSIHYLVINTHNWVPGQSVLISPRTVSGVRWLDRQVDIDVDRDSVRNSPTYDSEMIVDRDYEDAFNNYYRGLAATIASVSEDMFD